MGATGLALLILSPGDAALTAVGWVWPPVMVALVVWMFVQMRRTSAAEVAGWSRPSSWSWPLA